MLMSGGTSTTRRASGRKAVIWLCPHMRSEAVNFPLPQADACGRHGQCVPIRALFRCQYYSYKFKLIKAVFRYPWTFLFVSTVNSACAPCNFFRKSICAYFPKYIAGRISPFNGWLRSFYRPVRFF